MLLACAFPALAQPPTLTLTPGGTMSAVDGATVGWGFTIANTSGQWIEITSANFCEATSGVTSACQAATVGTFTDIISGFNDIVVGPSPNTPTVSQTYNLNAHTGTGSFYITGPAGSTSGPAQIVLTYNVFSRSPQNPAFDPDTDTVSTDNFMVAPASVNVIAQVPALSTSALILLALILMAWGMLMGRQRARQSQRR